MHEVVILSVDEYSELKYLQGRNFPLKNKVQTALFSPRDSSLLTNRRGQKV